MPKPPPTYEELRAQRAKEWESAQSMAAKHLAEVHAGIAQMPDVKEAPAPGAPWASRGITCPHCGGETFYVSRWVTVNGVRHRAELECATCSGVETWDFNEKLWLP